MRETFFTDYHCHGQQGIFPLITTRVFPKVDYSADIARVVLVEFTIRSVVELNSCQRFQKALVIQYWTHGKYLSETSLPMYRRHDNTPSPAYNEQIDAKKTARSRRVLVVTKLFNIAVNDFDAKQSTHSRWVLIVTELVISGTQCIGFRYFCLKLVYWMVTSLPNLCQKCAKFLTKF